MRNRAADTRLRVFPRPQRFCGRRGCRGTIHGGFHPLSPDPPPASKLTTSPSTSARHAASGFSGANGRSIAATNPLPPAYSRFPDLITVFGFLIAGDATPFTKPITLYFASRSGHARQLRLY